MLKGKKTYIAAIALAIYGLLMGDMTAVLEALAVAGLRDAISK